MQTSLQFDQIPGFQSDKLTEQETRILKLLEKMHPCIGADVAMAMNTPYHKISGRFTSLKKKGYIEPFKIGGKPVRKNGAQVLTLKKISRNIHI